MLKKILSYSLIFILLISNISGSVLFLTNQYFLKNNIKEQIESNDIFGLIEILTFDNEEIKNHLYFIHEFEFKYQNNLYDIVKTNKTDSNTTYYVINDTKEEILIYKFANNDLSKDKIFPFFNFNLIKSLNLISIINEYEIKLNIIKIYTNFIYILKTVYQYYKPEPPPPKSIISNRANDMIL